MDCGMFYFIEQPVHPNINTVIANSVISLQQTKEELLDYLQATHFPPVSSTLLQAINNNNLITFPGLDNMKFVKKHYIKSEYTTAGHLK